MLLYSIILLTHWGRMTHICVGYPTIIGSQDDLSPDLRQTIIWTNAVMLLITPVGTNFSEILSEIQTFSFNKMYFKKSFVKWRPYCLGLNVWSMIHIPQRPLSCTIEARWHHYSDATSTHWGRGKMNILQAWFSKAFSSMKMFEFRFKFHWNLCPMI